ncbi:MAG: S-layer homology domain-containing protein [Oscillospiraceae bacterium]
MADVKLGADLVDAALAEIADGGSVASWARAGVAFCYLGGIMNGMGGAHFDPTGMLTRAQLAQVFFNLYNIGMDQAVHPGAGTPNRFPNRTSDGPGCVIFCICIFGRPLRQPPFDRGRNGCGWIVLDNFGKPFTI